MLGPVLSSLTLTNAKKKKENQPFLSVHLIAAPTPNPHPATKPRRLGLGPWTQSALQKCQHPECVRKGKSPFYEKSPTILALPQGRALAGTPPRHTPGKRRWRQVTSLRSGSLLRTLGSPAGRTPTWRPQPARPPCRRSDWPRAAGAAPRLEATPPNGAGTRREVAAMRAAPQERHLDAGPMPAASPLPSATTRGLRPAPSPSALRKERSPQR